MEEYIVFSNYGKWDNIFLVSAENKKDAIEKVYDDYYIPLNEILKSENIRDYGSPYNEYGWKLAFKKELKAESCKMLHKQDGIVSILN